MLICGIDAGFSGAWGMIDHNGDYWSCGDMHTSPDGTLDSERIWDEMRQARDGQDLVVVVEKVHSMPRQGVASTFKFGTAFGTALCLAKRFKTTMVMVTPQEWKKSLKIDSSKSTSLNLARVKFSQAPLRLVKYGGRAEALLIAEWYRGSLKRS